METSAEESGVAWVPRDCTLTDSDRVARAAEFGEMFASAVRRVERPAPTRLRLELEPSPATAARVAELAANETACCSFFTFTLTATAGGLVLEVAVPEARSAVLEGLAKRAAEALAGS
jgi:hypothetical protein